MFYRSYYGANEYYKFASRSILRIVRLFNANESYGSN